MRKRASSFSLENHNRRQHIWRRFFLSLTFFHVFATITPIINKEHMRKEISEPEIASDLVVYEVGFHIIPSVSEEAVPAETATVKSVLVSAGASVFASGDPELIALAYPMTKKIANKNHVFDSAYFGWMKFEADPASIMSIKTALDGNANILRYLILKTTKDVTPAQALPKKTKEKSASDREEKDVVAPEMSSEELDKTIDELVID